MHNAWELHRRDRKLDKTGGRIRKHIRDSGFARADGKAGSVGIQTKSVKFLRAIHSVRNRP